MNRIGTRFTRLAAVQGIALLAMAGAAAAAVSLAYTSTSTSTLGALAPPVTYEAGPDAAESDYVPVFTLSANGTAFTATLRGVPEASVTLTDLLRVKNNDGRAHTVTLSSAEVANAYVATYVLAFYDEGGTLVGSLDFKDAAPSVTFPDMPAGATYTARATLALAGGAGSHNVADAQTITMEVSA